MMYWNDHGMNGWGYGLATLTMLLFWGLLITGAVLLFRHLGRAPQRHSTTPPDPPAPQRPEAERLLAERLARGEADTDKYHRLLNVLRAGRDPSGAGLTRRRQP